jgi:rod shape-determining protein MreC
MERILRIFLANGSFFTFFGLQIICFWLIINYNSVQSEIASETWSLYGGWFRSGKDIIDNYLDLDEENDILLRENAQLKARLPEAFYNTRVDQDSIEDEALLQRFTYLASRVINRTPYNPNNTFVLDRGEQLGVSTGQGVIGDAGLLGIIDVTTSRYARAISILHLDTRISGGLKNNAFGTLRWDGKDARFMNLSDIPEYISVNLQDTVFTTGYSNVFPTGIPIGTISEIEVQPGTGNQLLRVRLINNPLRQDLAYIVQDLFKEELEDLNTAE